MEDRRRITRRRFLEQATAAGAGVAATGAFSRIAYAAPVIQKWDQETDVIVVGAGAAGFAAAIEAADAGAEVLLLEKLPIIGGCSLVSGGNYGSWGTDVQKKAAEEDPEHFGDDSADLYYKERLALGGYMAEPEMVRVFADEALNGYNWMVGLGMKWSTIRMYADLGPYYAPDHPSGNFLHSIFNMPYDKDGVWVGPFTKGRHHRGGTYKEFGNGVAAINCLADNAESRGVKLATEMQVVEIIRENGLSGPVLGVIVMDLGKGDTLAIRARKGVVLTAGGFTANAEMCKRYDPRLSLNVRNSGTAAPGSPGRGVTGEVLVAAMDIGADAMHLHMTQLRVQGSTVAYTGPGSLVMASEDGTFIDVDDEGKRFWTETSMTAYRMAQLTLLHEKGMDTWWGITDSDNIDVDEGVIANALKLETAYQADTLEELAKIIKVPEANLVEQVNRWNQCVDNGVDDQFGQPKPLLKHKIDKAPFYAEPKTYYRHTTTGGLRCNTSSQVLDRRFQPIPHLYAAGEIVGNVHGMERNGGCGWTNCIVFGRIAGQQVAAEAPAKA